ncbi:MAG: phosphatidylserine decarboxylase family protein [Flavobacteriales bacterium]|nr:MAG: phosphatidylserine decarboxylase family protein [Flavobacteriales bacterium]
MFHKEGYKIIFLSMVIMVILIFTIDALVQIEWLRKTLMLALVILFLLILQFFRNPKRNTVLNEAHIIAPVDGKVVVIEEVFEKEYFNEKRRQISIFMSPVNVHVTRYPVGGEIAYSKYHPGKYLVAWHPKSSEENERTTVVVENKIAGKILYRQIAGAMAKRIVNYAKEGDAVVQGKDSGFIKFGSRVDVLLPLNATVTIQLNQKVRGGETVIAEIDEKLG